MKRATSPKELKMTQFEKVDAMENLIIENLGAEGALFAIIKALGYDIKKDIYEYIIRCYDLEID